MRKLTFALMLALLFGFAAAQNVTPTDSAGDTYGGGEGTASVTQDVNLKLPLVTALHLTAPNLVFDIAQLNAPEGTGSDMVCVYGDPANDEGDSPLGTRYETVGTWQEGAPTINIVGGTGSVTQYPPYIAGEDGDLVEGSKEYFVCYKTFILQKFSNTNAGWELEVSRSGGTYDMWIQDNSVCSFNDAATPGGPTGVTGLHKLVSGGDPVSLLPDGYTSNTTGYYSELCSPDLNKSWLDDLVVIAVKVNGEVAGDNIPKLTYTLTSELPINTP